MTTDNIPETMDSTPPGRVPVTILLTNNTTIGFELTDLDIAEVKRAFIEESDHIFIVDRDGDEVFVRGESVAGLSILYSAREVPEQPEGDGEQLSILPLPGSEA